jgi:hypothetical protein
MGLVAVAKRFFIASQLWMLVKKAALRETALPRYIEEYGTPLGS